MHNETEDYHWASYGLVLSLRLKKIRKARGFSQEVLAELSNVSRNTISNLERNENNSGAPIDPVMTTMYRLARALDVPPAALFPAVGDMVSTICAPTPMTLDIRWPVTEEEKALFDAPADPATPSGSSGKAAELGEAEIRMLQKAEDPELT